MAMQQTQIPDAARGRKAVKTLATLLMLGLGGVVVAGAGVITCLYSAVSALAGGGAGALLVTGTALFAAGTVAATACRKGGQRIMLRDQHHMLELTRQEEEAKLGKERQALAASQKAEQEKERQKLERAAQIDFNAQAATKLKNDVKPMRPLKFTPKPQQQQQQQAAP